MKKKIVEDFKEFSSFTNEPGCSKIVSFKDMAISIFSNQWFKDQEENVDDKKMRVITAATDLIKSEIRCKKHETNVYPSKNDIEMGKDFSPQSLKLLMEYLISNNLKLASFGQFLLKVIKPNSALPPLFLGFGLEVNHATGTKNLLIE